MKRFTRGVSNQHILANCFIMKKLQKVLIVFLLVFMVVGSILPNNPNKAYALDYPTNIETEETEEKTNYKTTTDSDFDISNIELDFEDKSKRTEDTKTFRRVDGTYVLAMYNQSVHYLNEGVYEDIDNTLSYDEETNDYENKANKFKIKLPKTIDDNKKFKLTLDDYQIDWTIDNIYSTDITYSNEETTSSNLKELTKINQSVVYNNIQNGVDLEYIISGSKVKENIILNEYVEDYSLVFNYYIKNLELVQKENESYVFLNEQGDEIFSFESLYMYDSNNEVSYEITFDVTEVKKDEYRIEIIPNDDFLLIASYPVTIDPTISSDGEVSIVDTYLDSEHPNTVYDDIVIKINDGGNFLGFKGYINFIVPEFLQDYDIVSANLKVMDSYFLNTTGTIFLHELDTYYNLTNLTWGDYSNDELVDYYYMDSSSVQYRTFDITQSVKNWNEAGIKDMPGFELTTNGDLMEFKSTLCNDSPIIEIVYIDMNGIKDYWTYSSQELGIAGTGYVSDFTGQMNYIRNDLNFSTDRLNLSLSFAYNPIDKNTSIGYGDGWNIFYNLKLEEDSSTNNYYTIDYTGNKTYYHPTACPNYVINGYPYNETCYVSESKSNDILVVKDVDDVILDYKLYTEDSYFRFDTDMYLNSIRSRDYSSNYITITRNPNDKNIVDKINDSAGNYIELDYNYDYSQIESARLYTKDITGVFNELERVNYYYNSSTNKLSTTNHRCDYNQDQSFDYRQNHFYYDTSDRLYRINGYDEEQIEYTYNNNNQITKIESFYDYNKISEVNYSYSNKETIIIDHSGNFIVYKFDNYGHTVNILDSDANSIFYEYRDIYNDITTYLDGEINYKRNHEIYRQSSPQKPIYNPIENYSFEDGLNGWNIYTASGADISVINDYQITGENSLKISTTGSEYGYVYQTINLNEGYYHLQVDVKNCGIDNDEVYIYVNGNNEYIDNDGLWHTVIIPIYVLYDDSNLSISLNSYTSGNVYFDNLILYENNNTSRINVVDNPSFEYGITGSWDLQTGSQATFYSINGGTELVSDLYEEVLGMHAVGLNGKISTSIKRNYLEDILTSNGSIFVSGWSNSYTTPKINNANLVYGKNYRILIEQYNTDNNLLTYQTINFNQSYEGWQFIFGEIVLLNDCDEIKISFEYNGEGEVLFDGLSVFYKVDDTEYDYNDYGRILSVSNNDGSYITYSYEEDDDEFPYLVEDQNGNSITIESDGTEITEIIRNNVKSTPTYNYYGQIETIHIGDSSTYFESSTTYTSNCQYLASQTNEHNNTTNYYTDEITGLLEYITNSKNIDTNYEYYDNGVLKKVSIQNSDTNEESYVEYVYDSNDRLIEMELESGYSYYITYDSYNRIATIKVNNQTLMSYDYIQETYDLVTYETNKLSQQTYGNGDKIVFIYNDDDQIETIQFQGSGDTLTDKFNYEYDSFGRLYKYKDLVNNITETYEYDFDGNLSSVKDNLGNYTNYYYDNNGNLSAIEVNYNETSFSTNYYHNEDINSPDLYDRTEYQMQSDSLTTIKKDYLYDNDALKRLDKIKFIENVNTFITKDFTYIGNTTRIDYIQYSFYSSNPIKYKYFYDELGNITKEEYYENDILLITKEYIYDDLNQLIEESSCEGSCTTLVYDENNYTKYYGYDSLGNMIKNKTMKYGESEYQAVPIPNAYQNNSGQNDMYVKYNGNNSYTTIFEVEVGGTISMAFDYYESGSWPPLQLSGITTTCDASNVNLSQAGYYLYECHAQDRGGLLYNLDFSIVIKVGEPVGAENQPQFEVEYNYSSTWKDQLEDYTIVTDGVSKTSSITYDLQGNPTEITNFFYESLKYAKANLHWDGRQLVKIEIYDYSGGNYILEAKLEYTYNDQGYRICKKITEGTNVETIDYYLQDDKVLYETNGTYAIIYTYDYDGSLISFNYDNDISTPNDGVDYFYITNQSGDITHLVDINGEILVQYYYDAYGNITNIDYEAGYSTVANINPYRYKGYRYDSEINMYYLNSRYYNPEISRFINADGLLGEIGNIQSTNMYAYCANNPVMFTDSTGMSPKTWMIIGSLALITVGIIFIGTGGGILVAAGAGSLLGGFTNEQLGGKFEAGWFGGLISGALLGAGSMVGAELLYLAAEANGFAIIGLLAGSAVSSFGIAAIGGGVGSYVQQRMDHGVSGIDRDKIYLNSLMYGLLGLAGSLIPQGSIIRPLGNGWVAAFCVSGEIVIDVATWFYEMIDSGEIELPKPIFV